MCFFIMKWSRSLSGGRVPTQRPVGAYAGDCCSGESGWGIGAGRACLNVRARLETYPTCPTSTNRLCTLIRPSDCEPARSWYRKDQRGTARHFCAKPHQPYNLHRLQCLRNDLGSRLTPCRRPARHARQRPCRGAGRLGGRGCPHPRPGGVNAESGPVGGLAWGHLHRGRPPRLRVGGSGTAVLQLPRSGLHLPPNLLGQREPVQGAGRRASRPPPRGGAARPAGRPEADG
jgi:hypothetical protein